MIESIQFINFKDKIEGKEGIVILGAGGELQEWVSGICSLLNESGVTNETNEDLIFPEQYKLITTGGRTDLALVVNFDLVSAGLAIWRIKFGDCSWISDYITNYAKHH
ncbi:MAG: hypothetical protein K0Q47_73 [Sedimentibacter sp.]|jgi:hypothetical protein|nr:hypothetical protein [Sedimentibacter sp.]